MGAHVFVVAWTIVSLLTLSAYPQAADYQIKDLQLRRPDDYAAHQSFQKLTIGAYPCDEPGKIEEIFDTNLLLDHGILPILVVISNQNDFPIRLSAADIYLVDRKGGLHQPLPYSDVLLRLYLEKAPSQYTVREEILIDEFVEPNALIDFKQKSFGEEIIAPGMDGYGVVFFPLPEERDISGFRLYFPRIVNVATNEPLIFFEFELSRSQP